MRLLFISIILFWLDSPKGFSQSICNTADTSADLIQSIPLQQRIIPSANYVVRVYVHIIRRTNGTGGQNLEDVQTALSILVNDFEEHGICISLLGTDEIWDDSYYYSTSFSGDTDNDGKFDNFSPNSHSNAIDMYLFGQDASFQGGKAAKIPSTAFVLGGNMSSTNLVVSHVISHELGHCLGLFHTFHGLCEGGCAELVLGTNCNTCGDFVCDTPADPQADNTNSSCQWNGVSCTGSTTDANGHTYVPNTTLIMAYVPPSCMVSFTNGQGSRMRNYLANSSVLQPIIVPHTLTLSSLTVSSGADILYDVINDITAQTSVAVASGGSLTLRAGNAVILKPGFSSASGSVFHAYIESLCSTVDHDNSARIKIANSKFQKAILPLKETKARLYPNPVNDQVNIFIPDVGDQKFMIKIFNSTGAVLKVFETFSIHSKITINNLQSLSQGHYFIQISSSKISLPIYQFIKE